MTTPRTLQEAQAAADALWAPHAERTREERTAMLGMRLDLFAALALKIRTKDGGEYWPFVLNPIQRDYLRSLRRQYAVRKGEDFCQGWRDLIVKPRQLGFSTFVAACFFFDGLLRPGRVTVVLSHDRKISEILLETYAIFWDQLPADLKKGLALDTETKYEFAIRFPGDQAQNPPSKFLIETEAGHPWRGGVIHNLHASEAAFYRDFKGFQASYLQAISASGNAVLETTANGLNDYYREVRKSLDGSSPFRVVFYEWFRHPEYRRPWDPRAQAPLVPEEADLIARQVIDLEQLAWRRAQIQVLGDLFPQEYPESLLGAFLSTGRPFFDSKAVSAGYDLAHGLAAVSPSSPRRGVLVWEEPQEWESYLLSADTAEGVDRGATDLSDPERGGSDYSCAYVLKLRTLEVVASIHGRFPPAEFASLIQALGRRYRATVAVERNNHGGTVLHVLDNANYPEVYRHLEFDAAGQRYLKSGFPTTSSTRPLILDALGEVIRRGALRCPDPGFWREAHAFHRNASGRPEALPGAHDDRILALAIGVYLATLGRSAWGLPTTTDGWGIQAASPAAAPPPVVAAAPPPSSSPWAGLAEARETARLTTCGACLQFCDGHCSIMRCSVRPGDPGCASHYPADMVPAEGADPAWGADSDWV